MLRITALLFILAYCPQLIADSGEDPLKQTPSDTLNAFQNEVSKFKEKIGKTPVRTFSQSGAECHILITEPGPGIDYKILQVVPRKNINYKCLKSNLIKRKPYKLPNLNKYKSFLKRFSETKE